MNKYEERARMLHKQGNNCSYSVYTSFKEDKKLDDKFPAPRSIEGKCGAVLAAEKILKDMGEEEYIKEFEEKFKNTFGYLTCVELMRYDRRCNDYVGKSVELIEKIITPK